MPAQNGPVGTGYSWSGVVDFLQDQVRAWDRERAEFQLEKAELNERIVNMEGQLRGQENVNKDLLRRIKMLEFALKQERIKYAKAFREKNPSVDENRVLQEFRADNVPSPEAASATVQQLIDKRNEDKRPKSSRTLLKRYLEELGYVDDASPEHQKNRTSTLPASLRDMLNEGAAYKKSRKDESNMQTLPAQPTAPKEQQTRKTRWLVADATKIEADVENHSATDPMLPATRMTWHAKRVLKNHVDSVRCLTFAPSSNVLATASEDAMIKLWDLSPMEEEVEGKARLIAADDIADVEPFFTLRGHTGPIFAMCTSPVLEGLLYTAGADRRIRCWDMPTPKTTTLYGETGGDMRDMGSMDGHTDVIWSLAHHPVQPLMLSASSDSTVKMWKTLDSAKPPPKGFSPLVHSLSVPLKSSSAADIPTSVAWIPADLQHFAAGFVSARVAFFDSQTAQVVRELSWNEDSNVDFENPVDQVNCIISHNTLPLLIAGHEDRCIRFYDVNAASSSIASMVGHTDALSCLAIDPSGLYLVSGAHDGSLRFWDLRQRLCLHEISAHRKKFEEATMCVSYHPAKAVLASGGADSVVKLYDSM
eukprot:GILK01002041.1.p1 GENE.GILK01002041.1~~GILK01002041.1.p1  ORF type:complete len:591 (-),score=98.15 GILK01002041.1:122-1894(-)